MQFRSAVFPAPLGPIRAVTRPLSTSSRTLRRTCNPPKLNETSSISSIRSMRLMPPADTAVLFHIAITALVLFLLTEVEFLDVAVLKQLLALAGEHHAAILQDVAVIGDG